MSHGLDRFFTVLGSIVTVALVTTIVSHPQSANVIKAIGYFGKVVFVDGIKAALSR